LRDSFSFMGRIRTNQITSITGDLVGKYKIESFADNFSANKAKLKEIPEVLPNKKIANKVAGSITRDFKKHRVEMEKLLGTTSGQ